MDWASGKTISQVKKEFTKAALERHSGNRTRAAREMGVSIRTLRNWINRWNLHFVGRELVLPSGVRVICPECWAPIAILKAPIHTGQEVTMGLFHWPWRPAMIDGTFQARCWWKGCSGEWFKYGRIYTMKGWIPEVTDEEEGTEEQDAQGRAGEHGAAAAEAQAGSGADHPEG